jgi:peptide/nickel transport system substrate-binding protein
MNKRHLLVLVSLVALLAIIVACAPAPTPVPPTKAPEPTKAPAPTQPPAPTAAPVATKAPEATKPPAPTTAPAPKYKESPLLADQVKAGKLPAVDQRLPENPLVMQAAEVGTYGGIWRRGFLGPSDYNGLNRVIYDVLARFGPDGSTIQMKLAESITPSSDYKTWTVKLRKGSKWSDGSPFTADDIMFWYNDVILNKELTSAVPSWMRNADGSTVKVEKIDDLSVKWTYAAGNVFFLLEMTTKDYGDAQMPVFMPAKWLKQFHAGYAKKDDLDKMVADAKFKTWTELFANKVSPFNDPNRPGMAAWIASTRISDQIFIMKRNPYYIAVDQAGNQLPYLDEVQFKFFADAQSLNLAAIAGELDQQERHINLLNFPVLKENSQKQGKYNIYLWSSPGGQDAGVAFNQTAKDLDLRKLFSNKDFRIAMSYAINRKQIQEASFLGTGEPRQSVPKKGHPYYPGDEWAYKYLEYNTNTTNQMLDKLGLDKKDADGFRLFPGTTKRVTIDLSVVEVFGPYRDIGTMISKDFEKVGIKTNMNIRERALHFQMRQGNDLQAEIWNQDTAGFPFTGSTKYDFRKDLYGTLTYGPLWKQWYDTSGKEGVEPPPEAKKIVEMQDKARTVGPDEQAKIAKEMFQLWVDNMFEIGTVGLTATDQGVSVVNATLKNVPQNVTKDWPLRTPGNAFPEIWFYKK